MASPSGYPEHVRHALHEAMECGDLALVHRTMGAAPGVALGGIPDTNTALDWVIKYGSSIPASGPTVDDLDAIAETTVKEQMVCEQWRQATAKVFAPEDQKAPPEPALGDEFRERVQRIALKKRHEFWGKVEIDCRGFGLVTAAAGAGAAIVAAGLMSWPASVAAAVAMILGIGLMFPGAMLAAWRCAETKARLEMVGRGAAESGQSALQQKMAKVAGLIMGHYNPKPPVDEGGPT